jgi:hypothetical protein
MFSEEQKIDYLKEDPKIPSQNVALVSMVEPTNSRLLLNRESFFATRFLKGFLEEYTQALTYKVQHPEEELTDIVKSKLDISYESIKNHYYEFQKLALDKLEEEFNKEHNKNAEPTITGFKVRGVFPSTIAAGQKAKELHTYEPFANIYAIEVGRWTPYCPLNDNEITPEYAEEKLNDLVKAKISETDKAKIDFEEQKIRRMNKIAEENEAKKSAQEAETKEVNDEDLLEILESDNDEEKPAPKPVKKNRRRRRNNNRRRVNRKN